MNKRLVHLFPISIILLLLSGCAQLGIYRLSLQAAPHEGPAPLTVFFTAEIAGGADTSPELHCQNQTWDFGDGRRMSVMGLCHPWRPGLNIDRQFQQTYTYEEPGVYEVTVSYGRLDSKEVKVTVVK